MSQITETICDQCGARKGKSNNWWKVEVSGIGWEDGWLTISMFNGKSQTGMDLCSEGCTMKLVSQFMAQPKKEEIEETE